MPPFIDVGWSFCVWQWRPSPASEFYLCPLLDFVYRALTFAPAQ